MQEIFEFVRGLPAHTTTVYLPRALYKRVENAACHSANVFEDSDVADRAQGMRINGVLLLPAPRTHRRG
jgi:hypothetical protein